MASTMWITIGAIAICGIIGGVVRDYLQTRNTRSDDRLTDLEEQVHDLETDLVDARERVKVLERIVTDGKYDLGKQIDDLAAS